MPDGEGFQKLIRHLGSSVLCVFVKGKGRENEEVYFLHFTRFCLLIYAKRGYFSVDHSAEPSLSLSRRSQLQTLISHHFLAHYISCSIPLNFPSLDIVMNLLRSVHPPTRAYLSHRPHGIWEVELMLLSQQVSLERLVLLVFLSTELT